jgi:hypothetical protein
MAFHLAAYAGTTVNSPQPVPPVTDMYLPSTQTGFLMPAPLKIVAAYAASPDTGGSNTNPPAGLRGAMITAPSLLRVAYPWIRPVSHRVGEDTDPNVMNMVGNPLQIPASESVGIDAGPLPGGVGAPVYGLLWFCDQLVPVPAGEKFVLGFSANTGSNTTTPRVWSPVGTINFYQSLPPGNYAVVGFEHWSPNAVAARLIFPGLHMRPGTLSMAGSATSATGNSSVFPSDKRTDRLFYEGGIGVYGNFNSFAPPSFEVLSEGTDSVHEGYLTVIRMGDAAPISAAH